ncbi:dystroglycan 1 [Melitaea cinxia]|uniref:dystroglycan 1 n=1 Tax=Melitaea cinxia TaxID=113334 RepID=UPI001E27132B|nr:dystroglycan 1 [Melitaea cinxia]
MEYSHYVACALLLLCPLALSRHDDDFAFDNNEEFQVELTANHSEIAKNGLRRLWGVPDTSAYVGHLFRMEIPKQAFSGDVLAYKVKSEDGVRMPSWLAVDTKHGLISGMPQKQDLGAHTFTVIAHGRTHGLTATDSFTIEVKKADEKPQSKYGTCVRNENRLVLVILIDGNFHKISPRQRIRALMELASFMALDGDEFWMEPYKAESALSHTVLMSGAGTTKRRKSEATTAIYLNVGCGEKLWSRHKVLVAGLREQSRDGTLYQILRLPVLGWRLIGVKPLPRYKRQTPLDEGSGAYDDTYDDDDAPDYSGYDEGNDNEDYEGPDNVDPPNPPHPHRHHHGQPDFAPHTTTDTFQTELTDPPTTTPLPPPPPSTPPFSPPVPTEPTPSQATTLPTEDNTRTENPDSASTNTYTTEEPKVEISAYPESVSETTNVKYSKEPGDSRHLVEEHAPIVIVPEEITTSTEPEMQTVIIRASNELPSVSSEPPTSPSSSTEETVSEPMTTPSTTSSTTTSTSTTTETTSTSTTTTTTPVPTTAVPTTIVTAPTTILTTTPTPEITTQEVTKQEILTSTERSSTIIGKTTETVPFLMPVNQPPILKHHMKKLAITAGKAFRYIIPSDLFTDPEEGSNLTFTMYEAENVPLSLESWIQFIPTELEVYGLPLEAHVSRWNFIVEARDSEGLVARGPLDITVQQHKSGRTINHQFIMEIKLLKEFKNAIDWQIRALEGIVNLFRDTDMDHLTVLNATQKGDLYEFVWTNDTLPKDPACPMDDINRLMKIMESESEPGAPSAGLARAMSPELKVGAVWWRGAGRCAPPTATRAPNTYPPVTRNQVDHLTATVGHLLVYKVPEDTFFDPEDGGTRNLQLSLRFSDRSEIPPNHWLQFDARNQEFYGLPTSNDEKSVHYQLIAEDSSKKSAYDSLIVEVAKAPTIRPTVEFQMTMDPSPHLADSASNKRKVVEKLAALFGQKETDNIRIQSITDNPTTIIWYNTSLPMDRCPKREIEELRKMIIVDERGAIGGNLKEHVDQIFDKDLKVMSIRLIPLGLCADQHTKTTKTLAPIQPGTNMQNKATNASPEYSDYLVTFVIPAVVIVCMIVVAGIIACVLYRRRRTGKMSVGDEEERQAFRSKGIPVIFQDELEERADAEPADKSPVIMREEKPPLLPPAPEYRSGEDAPYRPPPPFAASRTPPRPKATPTYRKPPPYVPP